MNELTPRQQQLKEEFVAVRGYWPPALESMLELDPDFFEAYANFAALPWVKGHLEPKVKELIYIAVDASTTHLFERGLRTHISNALKLGASTEEIIEVLQLTSVIGVHTCVVGLPILAEELEKLSIQQ